MVQGRLTRESLLVEVTWLLFGPATGNSGTRVPHNTAWLLLKLCLLSPRGSRCLRYRPRLTEVYISSLLAECLRPLSHAREMRHQSEGRTCSAPWHTILY